MKEKIGNAEIEWHANTILNDARVIISRLEKKTAKKIAAKAEARCPVWDGEKRKITAGDESYKARKPGSLRDSIKAYPSKYKNGGWIVMAGSYDVFYASFVELGTKSWWAKGRDRRYKVHEWMRRPIPEDPFLRIPLQQEKRGFNQKMREIFSK